MNTEITINGKPLAQMGVSLLAGAYQALLTPCKLKPFVENKDRKKPGTDVLVADPVVDERDVTLTFLVSGADTEAFMIHYDAFVAELHKGGVELFVPELNRYYYLIYSNSTQFENYRMNACKLAVKFREPNPLRNNGANFEPMTLAQGDVMTAANGRTVEVQRSENAYISKYSGSRIDQILTRAEAPAAAVGARTDIAMSQAAVTAELDRKADAQRIETVAGAAVTLAVEGGCTYLCGELTSLTIASLEDSPRETVIRFRSGAAATTLSIPAGLRTAGYWSVEANTSCEINIAGGLGVMACFD